MQLSVALPISKNDKFTNFFIDNKPFRAIGIMNLNDLQISLPIGALLKLGLEPVKAVFSVTSASAMALMVKIAFKTFSIRILLVRSR
jgi:hypothetical protein